MSKFPIPFGRHLLLERVNVGGMAEVFKAKAFGVEGFERLVAVKRILPTLADDDEFITMFIDEARIAAHLTHQNIVQIFELGRADKTFFISMEYVAGKDLRLILDDQKKSQRPMEIPKASFIVSRVCEALEYAHRKRDPAGRDLKIIHRDVTPQNVIISYEGEVKLCDFGIAKAASRVSRTQVGVLKGKFAYMSPEQVRGQPTDRRSDIFALGVIFYEMLTGERLFLAESDYATLDAVRQAVIPPPSKHNPTISPELEAIMLRMLSRDPKERYQWASEVHEELQDHLAIEGKRPYHSRHLRSWMQESYAQDIEIENGRLDELLKLKMPAGYDPEPDEEPSAPKPSEVVSQLAEKSAASDPANRIEVTAEHEGDDAGDNTDAIPLLPQGAIEAARAQKAAARQARDTEQMAAASGSPVASLYGTPEIDTSLSEDANKESVVVVRAPERRGSMPTTRLPLGEEETPESDAERTQFDMVVGALGESNETLFDEEGNETVTGGEVLGRQISAAQAELINKLDKEGVFESGDTVDAADEARELEAAVERKEADEPPNEDTPLDMMASTYVRPGPKADSDFIAEGTVEDGPRSMNSRIDSPPLVSPAQGVPGRAKGSMSGRPPARGAESGWAGPPPNGTAPAKATPSAVARATPSAAVITRATPSAGQRAAPYALPKEMQYVPPLEGTPPGPAAAVESSAPVVSPVAPARGLRNPRLLMLLAGGVALAAGLMLVVVVALLRPSGASLEINTAPIHEVEVRLDGRLVASRTPVVLEMLTVGEHTVELSAKGYRSHSQQIRIQEAKPHTMSVPLDPAASDLIADPPAPAPVAHAPAPEDEELPAGDAMEEVVPPPPPPPPPPSPAPPPARPAAAVPPPAPIEPKIAPPPPPARGPPKSRPHGALMVSTTPQGVAVLIDGKDTGLRTPIRAPGHNLPAGKHVITFLFNDGQSYNFDVNINEGEITKLIKQLR